MGGSGYLGFPQDEKRLANLRFSSEWISILANEVLQLLQLVGLELAATKFATTKLEEEKLELNDRFRLQRMLFESSRAEVLQMTSRVTALQRSEGQFDLNSGNGASAISFHELTRLCQIRSLQWTPKIRYCPLLTQTSLLA